MKDYDEMAKSVLKRRDKYVAERNRQMKKMASILSCFCLVALMGVGVWHSGTLSNDKDTAAGDILPGGAYVSDFTQEKKEQADLADNGGGLDGDPAGYSTANGSSQEDEVGETDIVEADTRLQERIQELQTGDSLGWLVVDGKIYVQSNAEYRETDADSFLGKASSFTGNYQDEDGCECEGDVYASCDNSDVIYIKLDNGGTVVLTAEDSTVDIPVQDGSTGALNGLDDVWVRYADAAGADDKKN
jgi:hypothetical protein